MSFEERNTITYLLVSLLVAGLFGSRIWQATTAGQFDGPGGLQDWAQMVLWFIPMAVGITIAAVILGNILYGIVTGGADVNMQEDERDKFIALRAMRVTGVVFSIGWLGAIVGVATGWTALAALNFMLVSGWLSDLVGNLVKLFFYRRGY